MILAEEMLTRYSTQEIQEIWSPENKFKTWQKIEIALCEVLSSKKSISPEILEKLKNSPKFDLAKFKVNEDKIQHEVIAFLKTWSEQIELKEIEQLIHFGITSSDLIDTGFCLNLKASGLIILESLDGLILVLETLCAEHKTTKMIARTHGVHAEPITFAFKVNNWIAALRRVKDKLKGATELISQGMFSGAVGNYRYLSRAQEAQICALLGLKPIENSTQVMPRDLFADFLYALVTIGCNLENIATELRNLQRTEILEVEEFFLEEQKGSSAMPHKKNPWKAENICGLARTLRSYLSPALENITLWHERDLAHSSVERIIFPDAANLTHFMLLRLKKIFQNLKINKQNMQKNLQLLGGMIYSQEILLYLLEETDLSREAAYNLIREAALKNWASPKKDKFFEFLFEELDKELSVHKREQIFAYLHANFPASQKAGNSLS